MQFVSGMYVSYQTLTIIRLIIISAIYQKRKKKLKFSDLKMVITPHH